MPRAVFLLFFKDPPAVIKVNERGPPHVASWVHILSGKVVTTKQPHFKRPFVRENRHQKTNQQFGKWRKFILQNITIWRAREPRVQ